MSRKPKKKQTFIKNKKRNHTCLDSHRFVPGTSLSLHDPPLLDNFVNNHVPVVPQSSSSLYDPFLLDNFVNNNLVPFVPEVPEVPSSHNYSPLHDNFVNDESGDNNIFIGDPKFIRPSSMREAVAKAAIITKTPRTAVNTWLYFLAPFGDVPRNYKTLLNTSRENEVKEINGNFWYAPSIELEIMLGLANTSLSSVTIDIHVDGIPIGSKELWPVTAFIRELKKPILLLCYEGNKKPDRKELLQNVFTEIDAMIGNGVLVEDRIVSVSFGNLLCDAPARALVLNVVSHNATFACFKCWARSFRKNCKLPKARKVKSRPSFPVFCNDIRTDAEFRSKKQYHETTSLTHHRSQEKVEIELLRNIDIIQSSPIDYMHTILLGVVRNQLIGVWSVIVPLFAEKINKSLEDLNACIPDEFPRKCRGLREDWKATEYRLFLLYLGPYILKNVLSEPQYEHFITLCIAMRIMCSEENIMLKYIRFAEKLMNEFVSNYQIIYPFEPLSYNLHMANHLPVVCREQQMNVDKFSCFAGENFLQKLKNYYNRGPNPLKQIIKRFSEEKSFEEKTPLNKFETRLRQNIKDTNLYLKCDIKNFTIGTSTKNSFIKAKNFVLAVNSIEHRGDVVVFKGFPCSIINDVFDKPTLSRKFGFFFVNIMSNVNMMEFTNREITHKFLSIPQKNGLFALVELLHGNENTY